jgi:selenocysteine-specific elongation factor
MTVVIGTAGHIDHGKTTLLRALTGIDADRLPEERRRGMTIDVGYAHLDLPDGTQLDFVDVPGHDKLVGNMLVGAGEIDAALLVVAADDGPRPQTLEHLELIDALGIAEGLAVVTKVDAVTAERVAQVVAATRELIDRTILAGAAVVTVSATSGEGLDELRGALVALAGRVLARGLPGGPARLGVDRAFSVKGRGVVVTGTLRGGPLERGTALRLLPEGSDVRIRELQVHGATVDRVAEGGRTAMNLGGVEAGRIHRGMVLVAPSPPDDGAVVASDRLLVALRPVAGLGGDVPPIPPDRARVRFHAGTEQVGAMVGRSGRDAADLPGGEVAAILRLERPVAVAAGDRFVLRRPSPGGSLAGGRVLDAGPPRGISRRRGTPERLGILAAATTREAIAAARLALHGAIAGNPVRLADDVRAAIGSQLLASVDGQGKPGGSGGWRPLAELRELAAGGLRRLVRLSAVEARAAGSELVDQLVAAGQLSRDGDSVARRGTVRAGPDPRTLAAMAALEAALDVPAPPSLSEAARAAGCPPDGIRTLESAGRIIRLTDDLAYAANAYRRLGARAVELAATAPLAPAALRDATGTSRKYVMAILEDLDRRGVLRRTPAGHVPGPRAAEATRS